MKASAVAVVALSRIELVECVVLAGSDADIAARAELAAVQPSAVVSISASNVLRLLIER
jgi:hypothetical protein